MIPHIFKHKPMFDNKFILVETVALENGKEQVIPVSLKK